MHERKWTLSNGFLKMNGKKFYKTTEDCAPGLACGDALPSQPSFTTICGHVEHMASVTGSGSNQCVSNAFKAALHFRDANL